MDMDSSAFRLPATLDESEPLGALEWAGLVARLGAERDLRRELSARLGAASSFSAGAAAALHIAQDAPFRSEPAVNPAALGHGKPVRANSTTAQAQASATGSESRGQE